MTDASVSPKPEGVVISEEALGWGVLLLGGLFLLYVAALLSSMAQDMAAVRESLSVFAHVPQPIKVGSDVKN